MASATSGPDLNSWQTRKSLADCFMYLFENHVDCDVTFRIQTQAGSVQTVPAHKFMLVARSPVFEEMFRGNKEVASRDLNVCDVEVEPFKEMMRYIYSDEVHMTGENVMHILYAAQKYKIEGLLDKCSLYLEKDIGVSNVADILSASVLYARGDLVKKCLDFMAIHTEAVLRTEGFTKMSYDALLKFLEYDLLPNDAEVAIYQGCIEWAKRQLTDDASDEEIRAVLGKCLHQIRFHQMPHAEFAETVGIRNVLNAEEKIAAICLILTNNDVHKEFLLKQGFNMDSRVLLRFNRFSSHRGTTFSLSTQQKVSEIFQLSVSDPISIVGISIFRGDADSVHDVSLLISEGPQGNRVFQSECQVISDGSTDFSHINIPQRKLEPNKKYNFTLSVRGPNPIGNADSTHTTRVANVGGVTINNNVTNWPSLRREQVQNGLKHIYLGYTCHLLFVKHTI